jgi:hypothetical protein
MVLRVTLFDVDGVLIRPDGSSRRACSALPSPKEDSSKESKLR